MDSTLFEDIIHFSPNAGGLFQGNNGNYGQVLHLYGLLSTKIPFEGRHHHDAVFQKKTDIKT